MNFALLISTFVTVFLAELGDKPNWQPSRSAAHPTGRWRCSSVRPALVLANLIGALAGDPSQLLTADWLQLAASLGFLIIGIKLLWPMLNGSGSWHPRRVRLSGPRPWPVN